VHFCNSEPLTFLKLKRIMPYLMYDPKRVYFPKQTKNYPYPAYLAYDVRYIDFYEIEQKCIILGIRNGINYIDEKFSVDRDLYSYEFHSDEKNDKKILDIVYMIHNVCKSFSYKDEESLPLFGDHLMPILQKNRHTFAKMIYAKKELVQLQKDMIIMEQKLLKMKNEEQDLLKILTMI
jgi:hypothetical protein